MVVMSVKLSRAFLKAWLRECHKRANKPMDDFYDSDIGVQTSDILILPSTFLGTLWSELQTIGPEKSREILFKYNCIEDTLVRANHFADVAIDSLSIFKNNEYKSALIKLIEESIKRLY